MNISRKNAIAVLLILIGLGAGAFIVLGVSSGQLFFTSSEAASSPLLREVSNADTTVTPPSSSPSAHIEPAPLPKAQAAGLYTLSIPKINLKVTVDGVGLTASGAMATTTNLAHVGWYEYGTKPGDVGTAVLEGHVDNALLLPGTFYNLKNLQPGDDIYITEQDGNVLHFVMTDAGLFDYKNTDTGSIFNSTGVPLLKLITCDGTWVQADRTYDHRLIVTAKLVTSSG